MLRMNQQDLAKVQQAEIHYYERHKDQNLPQEYHDHLLFGSHIKFIAKHVLIF